MFVIFFTPFFTDNAKIFLNAMTSLHGVRVGVVSQDPQEVLPMELRQRFAGHWRVQDALNTDQLTLATRELSKRHGPIHRLLVANEQSQVPVAEVRDRLGIEGMRAEIVHHFRDKAQMKDLFQQAGVPCARHARVENEADAWRFVEQVGFPICIKPLAGAAAQSTYRVESAEALHDVLRASGPSQTQPLQIEEFVVGEEHSFDTFSLQGQPLWHSLTRYLPTPLEAMRNPWIQWRIVLPREIDSPVYDDIRKVGRQALAALGMGTGLSHLEWFRRKDGSIAVSEVGARPPGAQIVTMMNRANDVDLYRAWCELMIFGVFTPPPARKYAVGTAFLRGLGTGRVKAVHGLDGVLRDLGSMATDIRAPQPGQPASISYEGEGYIVVRHPETAQVESALLHIVSNVRVELVS
ncbi:MAG: ATP-grasp domain-containing protein [Anaerolineae bacterium]|nr:ATP-grasp domain-containing protein [Anaerolineae bacterium]